MDRLDIRVSGLTSRRVERVRRMMGPPGSRQPRHSGWSPIVVVPVVLLVVTALSGPPSVVIDGTDFRIEANQVLLLLDMSGSMSAFTDATDEALAAIRSAGIWDGDAVRIGGSASRILETIRDSLAVRPGADAVWIISDFNDSTDLVVDGDSTRYRELVRLLLDRQVRLYLSTVNTTPTSDQLRAVQETGGAWHKFDQPSS